MREVLCTYLLVVVILGIPMLLPLWMSDLFPSETDANAEEKEKWGL